KAQKFRNVKIVVTGRPELSVRAPRGYVDGPKPAEPTTAAAAASEKPGSKKGPDAELRDALSDFYPTAGLPTLLSLTYLNTPANGLVVTSSIEIAGAGAEATTIKL